MRVLLTGGTGFVGSHVADVLRESGYDVRALVRTSSDTRFLRPGPGLELVTGALDDRASLERAVAGCEVVVHAAGLIKARRTREFFEVNVAGTASLAAAAAAAGSVRRFVLVSSLSAAGPSSNGRPLDESATPRPVSAYGRSKLEGERAVRELAGDVSVTVIRPSVVYGPRDRATLSFFRAVRRGALPIVGDGSNSLSVVYVADCAAAVAAALSSGPNASNGGTYFVDDGEPLVWREAVEEIELALGRRARLRIGTPAWALRVAAAANQARGEITGHPQMLTFDKLRELEQRHWVCSSVAARRDLGWAPRVRWAEGVSLAAEWYRREGWL
jgi:nucleoside-diphosphate-sugar epimerase